MYSEIHAFLQEREWAPIDRHNEKNGTTWLELFILFDTAGHRTDDGQHVKDQGAHGRAEIRRNKAKDANGKKKKQKASAIAKPSLDEELKRFKLIVRHTMRHEAEPKNKKLFQKMDN